MRNTLLFLCLLLQVGASLADGSEPLLLENARFRWGISPSASNLLFVDRTTGADYLRGGPVSPCALVRRGGREQSATGAEFTGDRLRLSFGTNGVVAVLKVESHPSCLLVSVESISGPDVDALVFLNVPLTLKGLQSESFGACALSMNLKTRVDALPALQTELVASCEKKFGMVGAKVAIVAAPMADLLPALQQSLERESELPVCRVAGPWARQIPFNHQSYLFNFGSLTESNVMDWVAMARSLGFSQIDNHGGGEFFRFGDLEPNRQKWPEGWESWRRIVSRLHQEGIGSILHTYGFFIDKRSKYVSPVPDARLDAFKVFALAEPLTADATEATVVEPTSEISTVTGFFEHNSVVLHIDDELVTFAGATRQAPWRFTGLKRGALNTRATFHERGTKARHLKECFGLFVPNPETSLFEEIAAAHADVVNRCDFDGIYVDAIDGSSILRGPEECWFWANKFVVDIQRRLKKPVGMEMSAMWHHFWQYRTRWQAWDYPQRGHQRFIDLHAEAVNGGLLLPLHLGWWTFQSFKPPQIEPTYPEVMENLGARLVGWDAGISLTAGVDQEALRKTPLFRRAADILRTCEELRRGNSFAEKVKAQLREPGTEFSLVESAEGTKRFRRTQSHPHSFDLAEPWSLSWRLTNTFSSQPVRFRIEALMSAVSSNATTLIDLAETNAVQLKRTCADGVSFVATPGAVSSNGLATLTVTNSGRVPRNAAWARLDLPFGILQNLKDRQGVGVEVEGDASGALLAIRLESPRHISSGAVADRYLRLDFAGRRSCHLVETESARWSDYVWNDSKNLYQVYRETVDFGAIESMSIWLQNIAPNQTTRCRIGPIKALSLAPIPLENPRLTVAGRTISFPVQLPPGGWIECAGADRCLVYGPKGQPMGKVVPRGDWPSLSSGVAECQFNAESPSNLFPRGRVTVFTDGEVL